MEEVARVNSFVVCLTPLAKIFQPKYHKELIENPESILDDKKVFQLVVTKPSGAINLEFRKPKLINDPAVLQWLTGGPEGDRCAETNYTGLVYAPVQDDVMEGVAAITAAMAEDPEKGKKVQEEISKTMVKKYNESMKAVKKLSEDRVMRTIKFVYNNLQKQYQINKENNMGLYQPSETELLCTFALQATIAESEGKRKEVTKKFQEILQEVQVI